MSAVTSTTSSAAEDMLTALRSAGHRVTIAREVVCDIIAATPDEHMTFEEILARAKDQVRSLDSGQVHRVLRPLEDLGFIHHVHFGGGGRIYHLSSACRNHHLVCEICGSSVDVPLSELDGAFEAVTSRHGFVPDSVHYAVVGVCERCNASGQTASSE